MDKANEYELSESEVIGRGAYGTVHLCKRKSDGRDIICKEIPMGQMSAEDRQGAMNEVQVHKMLPPHANIVQHFDYFIHEQSLLIVMEYVDGGTLYDFLQKRRSSLLEENEIVHLFVQLALALHHIHSKCILHRDIKTQNILLNKNHTVVKLSDFGISKILASKSKAYSVVGTPCYISPELCESKPYNQKSDMWALGCVLYELCTTNRAFEAPNLPALVFKIMKGSYQHISDRYSPQLRQLIRSLLNLDYTKRPTISQILAQPIIIKAMYSCIVSIGAINVRSQYHSNSGGSSNNNTPHHPSTEQLQTVSDKIVSSSTPKKKHARTSWVFTWGGNRFTKPTKLRLPSSIEAAADGEIVDIAIGRSHKFALTKTGKIFTWEFVEPNAGADTQSSMVLPGMATDSVVNHSALMVPRKLEGQGGVTVAQIACGDHFAACVTDGGILMTYGSGSNGCLGHGNFHDVKQLKIVEALIGCEVMWLSCGSNHAVALTTDQEIFSWGIGDNGRLGLKNCKGSNLPIVLDAQLFESNVVNVNCGIDTTCFITRNSKVYVCGSNKENKLGLDFMHEGKQMCVDFVSQPTRIKHSLFNCEIIACSVGNSHGAYLTSCGEVILAGSNISGQLGNKSFNTNRTVVKLDCLLKFNKVCCGDAFVTAATSGGLIYSWGLSSKGRLGRRVDDRICNGCVPGLVEIDDKEVNVASTRDKVASERQSSKRYVRRIESSHESTMILFDNALDTDEN